ncbi:MAG: DUF4097 family beta strand repeat-containing protein [Sedimentisphaerales bacterium]|nr:DUF4097 family beta strand repeat-containing protein [Sedimentisphaerales bacterium]NLT76676.1 DUF4097 domain-containing protein [Planctomycetota bacterium]
MGQFRMRRQAVSMLSMAAVFMATGCGVRGGDWAQSRYERTTTVRTPLDAGSNLDVETSSGSIVINGADGTDCDILATITAHAPTEAEAEELAEQVVITPEFIGNTLKVRAETPRTTNNRSVSVSYRIVVPRQTNVTCHSSYGSLELTGIRGTVTARTSSGSVKAENIRGATSLSSSYGSITCGGFSEGDLTIKTSSGKIDVSDATFGRCDAETSYGSVTGRSLQGETIRFRSSSGSLDLIDGTAGAMDLSTSYGRVDARQIVVGDLRATSGSGSLDVICATTCPPDLAANVKSSYGGVTFTAPAAFSGKVYLATNYGSVRTDRPITVSGQIDKKKIEGTIGNGSGNLRLETSSGSVTLR